MKKTSKWIRALALILSIIMCTSACSGNGNTTTEQTESSTEENTFDSNPGVAPTKKGAQEPAVDKETVKIALSKTFSELDGMQCTTPGFAVSDCIFEQLTRTKADGTIEPLLATSWERIDDYTWRFYLREGVFFTNGDEFNAETAAYSINEGMNAARTYRYYKYYGPSWPISAEVVDEYTVDIKTSAPNAKIPELIVRVAMWPLGAADDAEFSKHPIGTGPYVLESWELGSRVVLKQKDASQYWGELTNVKTLIFDIIENEETRSSAILAGEYDIVRDVPLESAYDILLDNETGMDLITLTSFTMSYILWNGFSDSKFVQDKNFRKACTYAIDYNAIQEEILHGLMPMATGIAPDLEQLEGYYEGKTGYPDYDPDMAKKLLAECGYDGEELVFYYSTAQFTSDLQISEAICAYLQAVGVNVKFEQIDSASWQTYKRTAGFALSANSVSGTSTCDVEFYYTQGCGDVGWSWTEPNEILDKLYSEGVTSEERYQLLVDLQEVVWDLQPYIYASQWIQYHVVNPDLEGFYVKPQNILYCGNLSWK